eukprot:TRINITY_DN8299_c0_g1_i1.p1 TRINITY_DN8299_c0_g1~~TRINITY_DN8299_c0_g1_i1.p1  ORF type:complete len:761 (+),score=167.24 TRINITY_DN8299_c0_g1_i1:1-2283(+)
MKTMLVDTDGLGTPTVRGNAWMTPRHAWPTEAEYEGGLVVATGKVRTVKEGLNNLLDKVEKALGEVSEERGMKLKEVTKKLRGMGVFGELAGGQLAAIKEDLHKMREKSPRSDQTLDRLARLLLVYIGIYTRTLKLYFGTRHLSLASRPTRRFHRNTWPYIKPPSPIASPPHTDPQTSPKINPSEPLVHPSRLGRSYLPPPLETPCSPFHSWRDTLSPHTPLSRLSAHVISTIFKKKDPITPTKAECILCRVCEIPVPTDRVEAHTETCVERMTTLMVLDHVVAQLKKSAVKAGKVSPKEEGVLQSVAEHCFAVGKGGCLTTILNLIHSEKIEAEEFASKKCLNLLEAAYEACDGVKRANEIALDVLPPHEMTPLDRLRRTAHVGIGDFQAKAVIARGAFGRVFLVEKKTTKDQYALKVMPTSEVIERHMTQKLLNERNIMAFTDSKLIVKLHYAFASTEYLYLAMDYHAGGDLFSLLERVEVFTEPQAAFYTAEIYLALEHLHKMSIVHRDVKPDNCLLSNTGHVMLTDFGLSDVGAGFVVDAVIARADQAAYLTPKAKQRADKGGTPDYVSPEIILGEPSGKAADFWSLGALLYEFLMGCPPFSADTHQQTFDNILKGTYQEYDGSPSAQNLIASLLQFDPADRLTNLREHVFFSDINWDTILTSTAPIIPDLTKDNFKERSELFEVSEADLDFLKEEIDRGSAVTPTAGMKEPWEHAVDEFLRRPQENDCLSLLSFQLTAPHVATLAAREVQKRASE